MLDVLPRWHLEAITGMILCRPYILIAARAYDMYLEQEKTGNMWTCTLQEIK